MMMLMTVIMSMTMMTAGIVDWGQCMSTGTFDDYDDDDDDDDDGIMMINYDDDDDGDDEYEHDDEVGIVD